MDQAVAYAYLIALHVALLYAAVKSSRFVKAWHRLGLDHPYYTSRIARAQHVLRRMDATVPSGAVVLLGDSLMAHLAPTAVAPLAVNFAVPGQRSDHLLSQLPAYTCLNRARAVAVMIGTNDIVTKRQQGLKDRYEAILAAIPRDVPVVMASIPPLRGRQAEVAEAARAARAVCDADNRCLFVDAHAALSGPNMLMPDGVHLSDDAYRILLELLRPAVLHAALEPRPATA